MEKIMLVNDYFRVGKGNLVIAGISTVSKFKTKDDIKSRVGEAVTVIKPNGDKMYIKVKSVDVAISIAGLINIAIELTSDLDESDIPRNSVVYV